MKRTIFHALAALAVIGAASSAAYAVNGVFNITRPGPTVSPPYSAKYKYVVQGTKAKGSEKYHMSVGDCFTGSFGVSCSGDLEASKHERSAFNFGIFAPIGNGTTRETWIKCNFDSKRGSERGTALDRDEFGFAIQRLDDDLGGTSNAGSQFKKPPVAVNGLFQVDRLKVKGKVRLSRNRLSGSLKFLGTGVVTTGENQGKKFKAQLKTRIKNADEFER